MLSVTLFASSAIAIVEQFHSTNGKSFKFFKTYGYMGETNGKYNSISICICIHNNVTGLWWWWWWSIDDISFDEENELKKKEKKRIAAVK